MNITAVRLREERKRLKLSQADVAKRLSLTRPAYVKYETGSSTPQLKTLMTLAEIFSVSTDYLLGKTNERNAVPVSSDTPQPPTEPVKEWLRKVCAGNEKALAALDHIKITSTGEIKLDGADIASEAVLQHTIKSLISALENATPDENGNISAEWKPGK